MHIWGYVMISGPWNPGFQDSRSALELASFDWFQHVGYESHSVYVKKLDFQHRISKFHHSWKLPGIFWNSGYCLEMANFLPIAMYRVLFPLSFWPRTWFSMRNSKIPSILESSRNCLELWNSSGYGLLFAKFDKLGIKSIWHNDFAHYW